MARPDRIRNIQLLRLISVIPDWVLVTNTMSQAMASTTKVLMAVARLLLTPSIPTLAKMEVRAAKTAESKARINHIAKPPIQENVGLLFHTQGIKGFLNDTLGCKSVEFQNGLRCAAAAKFIIDAVAHHRHRAFLAEQFANCAAQAADY